MMGKRESQSDLFSYSVNLAERVRSDHPLRKILEYIDFSFVRDEVAACYGSNGNVSEDPEVIMKMMFLLFYYDLHSERELMRTIPERLDFMWFLGYGLDDKIPNHSVLSKARKRWGSRVFEDLFIRTIWQCMNAGLIDGHKIYADGSLVDANASNDSILKAPEEVITFLKQAFQSEEAKLEAIDCEHRRVKSKLDGSAAHPDYKPVNKTLISRTDPDAPVVRQKWKGKADRPRPRYKNHRVVDDAHGVITGVRTTLGDVDEGVCLTDLIDDHQHHTAMLVDTVVADSQYGTNTNFRTCAKRGIISHMADRKLPAEKALIKKGLFTEKDFIYDPESDSYCCPAGRRLKKRNHRISRLASEYAISAKICNGCLLRKRCTRSKSGRSLKRHDDYDLIAKARRQSRSVGGRQDRRRRAHLIERSFADAANFHGFKQARWRGLGKQRIQDYLIAAVQNIRILISKGIQPPTAKEVVLRKLNSFIQGSKNFLLSSLRFAY